MSSCANEPSTNHLFFWTGVLRCSHICPVRSGGRQVRTQAQPAHPVNSSELMPARLALLHLSDRALMIHLGLARGHKDAETCVCASIRLSPFFPPHFNVCLIAATFTFSLFRFNLRVWNLSESPKWCYKFTQQKNSTTWISINFVIKGETLTDRCFYSTHVSLPAGYF